ncbi:protein Wnt-1-like isoform X2 [Sitodiplosis mosellana]|uniref:protein Wnt-1-like isoform X2 n=1 Tax=Sitodiplosis mosellana TaxID=263140 RepID=UPI0024444BE3|nr:protein Wnt-1-like isoform X2 [Sitodiplosis mosellana]
MHLVSIAAVLVFAMPITGFRWAEGSNLLLDPYLVCKKSRRLRGKYYEMCKNETSMMREIGRGISMGFKECEHQFKHHRWNCSSIVRSMRKILLKDTRETSFVSAITAAGITYAITRACTMGDLVECSCDKNHILQYNTQSSDNGNGYDVMDTTRSTRFAANAKHKRRRHNTHNSYLRNRNIYRNVILPEGNDWQWGGCGDNVMFGFRKSKDFLDSRYQRLSDIRTLVKLHNNNAGRLAVKNLMRVECKCHGLSGSCTIKTCWMKMAPFRDIGSRLKERFDGAAKVIARNDGHSFMPEIPSIKQPTRHDLVYTEDSSDFCRFNAKTGSLGTIGRECNSTSAAIDGCDLLCCNRGYDHKIIREKVNCRCMFKWCCEVTCSTCIERREVNTCK